MPIETRPSHDDLVLYDILRHPALCGEFIRNIDNFERLDTEEEFIHSYYQNEILCDFHPRVSLCCARAVGKTLTITDIIEWILVNKIFPDNFIVYTVPSRVHLEPVFTELIRMFRNNSFLKNFIEPHSGINNSNYTITLITGAMLACRIAGQSNTGANVVGLHTPFIAVDEAGYFPHGTFQELQPSLNTWQPGYRLMTSGVPTGLRENNILYHVDRENPNYTKHRISSYENPRVTKEDEEAALIQYGGRESDDFIHYFLGQHGKPVFSLFDRASFHFEQYPVYKLEIDGIRTTDLSVYLQKMNLLPSIPNKASDVIAGIDLGYCYSSDTEVLTKRGWLKHQDITTDDVVACFDTETSKIKWDNPLYIWKQDYKGDMLEVSGKSTNFMVSPEHSVWISKLNSGRYLPYEKLKAKDLLNLENNRFRIKNSAPSEKQAGPRTFDVPNYITNKKERKSTVVDMSAWLQFLAWFISEGSATANVNWEVNITQSLGKYSKLIDEMFSHLPYTVSRKEFTTQWGKQQINWRITCKELCLWLRENCGIHSENKKIPNFVFDCSSEDQELFLRTLLMGDGSRVSCNRSPQYNSQSEELVDQFQRMAISLGYSSTKGYYRVGKMYRATLMNKQDSQLYRNSSIRKIDYDGKIYCLKTTTGFYITRRKGKTVVAGNTEPTAIIVMYIDDYKRLRFHARIKLTKVSYPIQEKIIDIIDTRFAPSIIGIDRGNIGVSVIQNLWEHRDYVHKNYKKIIYPVDFSSWLILGTDSDGTEVKSKTKPFAVTTLQDYTNNHKIIYSSTDMEMVIELERMTYTKNESGDITYKTLTPKGGQRGEDHFTSALLCGVTAYYLNNEFVFGQRGKKKLFKPTWVR